MSGKALRQHWLTMVAIVWLASIGMGRADFNNTNKTLYVVATAHLDDQWNWTIQDTINSYIPNTLHKNFSLFEKYPDYKFSFEESFRYGLIQEYYPDDFMTLSNYIKSGRWRIAGTAIVAGDVIMTSPESLMREILYSTDYWKKEFNITPVDLFLPDCFGFPYSLPSVASYCGLKGFSTQKLQAQVPMIPIPFQNIGKWVGVDGNYIVAALQPGSYHSTITDDLSTDATRIADINSMGAASGVYADYMYFGTGDTGGAPDENSVKWLEQSVTNTSGSIKVVSAGSDQLFRDLSASDINKLPIYQGELLLKYHGTGCYTAHSEMKRYHRQNEQRAAAAESASVIADWLQGGGTYPQEELTTAWERFLWHTFHDDLTGTSIDAAYNFSWNDELLSLNQFSSIEKHGVGIMAKALDTTAQGIPLIVFNPLSIDREDVVETRVTFTNGAPPAVKVFDANGNEVPSQFGTAISNSLLVTFIAKVPATGSAVFDVRPADSPSTLNTGLSITTSQLENAHYRVQLNSSGDVVSIYDKISQREMLSEPIRWEAMYDLSTSYPVWEILYSAVTGTPTYLGGTPTFQILENGPARVSLGVTRFNGSSTFTERIRLAAGDAGDRVEWNVSADWGTRETLMKVAFPLAVTNSLATYDLGLGTIQRPTDTANAYEVPAQQWADLTQPDNSYGVTIMNDCKYGWDKPDDSTLRLTIFHTPDPGGSGYGSYQQNNDIGWHEFTFALMGHNGDWRNGGSSWVAARLNQPLQAFQTTSHAGGLGKTVSFLSCDNTNVMVKAIKKAENSDETIVRLQELTGKPQTATITCAGTITAAREVNGVEMPLNSLTPTNGTVTVSLNPYQPVTLALTIPSNTAVQKPDSLPVNLPYNLDVISTDANRADGNFDGGYTYPAELLPTNIVVDGITFNIGPTSDGMMNAVSCQGQTIPISGDYDQLSILAASATDDTTGLFSLNGQSTNYENLTVRYFTGFIGQWNPPLLKKDEVARVCTHRHTAGGTNDAYRFCYLFKYNLPLPPDVTSITLPNAPGLRIFAMSLAANTTDETTVAGGLLDEVIQPWANAGTNQTVSVGEDGHATITLNGSAQVAGGTISSYVWSENGVVLSTNSNPTLSLSPGSHTLLLTVTDDQGVTSQDAVSVTVLAPPNNGVWINPSGGDWNDGDNWSGGNIASGSGNLADFSTLALNSNVGVTIDDAWTIGNLTFDDHAVSRHTWTLQGDSAGSLTLDDGATSPLITATAPVVLNLPLASTNGLTKAGQNSLTLSGANNFGSGGVYVNAGTITFTGDSSYIGSGNLNVSNGIVNINTTGILSIGNFVELGGLEGDTKDFGFGAINQISGTVNVGNGGDYLEIGVGTNAYGCYNFSSGTLNIVSSSGLRVGASGIGLFNQSGGTLDCSRYFAVGTATDGNSIGGGRGVATFTGGSATLGTANYRVILGDKTSSTSVLNIGTEAGGNAFVTSASTSSGNQGIEFLDVSGVTMSAALNLNSGIFQIVGPIWRNTSKNSTGIAYLNFNGGTLQAGANQPNFITNALTAVNVYRGGAVIDTQGYDVKNSAPLLGASGKGIYPAGGALTVTAGGSGYLSAPMVTVTGGSGSNAMAIATVSNGIISSITMTCPGENYRAGDVVSFTFSGGGAAISAAVFNYTLQADDVSDNSSGGLTKLGAGTLTLSATNNYGGDTVVSGGTLNIAGQLSGNGTVQAVGGTLAGTGKISGAVIIGNGGAIAPGNGGIGSLLISNSLTFLPGATCDVEINHGAGTNDLLNGLTQVKFDGTLEISNLGNSLAAGDSFKLFNANNYSGDFSAIIPAAPRAGLAWNTSQLDVDGRLAVITVNTNSTQIAVGTENGKINLHWPDDHVGWRLQMQTNSLDIGLSVNWVNVVGSRNTNTVILPLDKNSGSEFFRLIYP